MHVYGRRRYRPPHPSMPEPGAATDTAPTDSGRTADRSALEDALHSAVLARDPICVMCKEQPSTHADHWPLSRALLDRAGLAADPGFARGLCATCTAAGKQRRD
ncbi:hypothetical protein ACN20G_16435 [Streptomyces sp. BI20]|uniref:hypothetical protein n=1 Tax=Streptomyces sp. BI20 TaxID=3403460 RepID=UPI003C73FECC